MTSMRPDVRSEGVLVAEAPLRGEKDHKLPVFLLPGLSGDLEELGFLLSPTEAPLHFVPIDYRHWSRLRREANDLDRLIADCISQIESYGPPTTILLVGYSFGGLMAWAVARAMAASGHRMVSLGLIDTNADPALPKGPASTVERWERLVRGIRRGETGDQLARLSAGALFRSQANWARAAFRRLHGFGFFPRMFRHVDLNIQMRYHLILLRECTARMAASTERLQYPAILFRGNGSPPGGDTDLGWTRFLSELHVVTVSGNHESVLNPRNARQIIEQLSTTIPPGEQMPRH
jgi:thioesterase domain-containing protein